MSNNDKPQFDGDFLCLVSTPQPCGSVITRWRVVTLDMNVWLINPGETVNEWHPLPRIDENGKVVVEQIKAAVDSAWVESGGYEFSALFSRKLHGDLRTFSIKFDTNAPFVERIIKEIKSDNPGFFNILIY